MDKKVHWYWGGVVILVLIITIVYYRGVVKKIEERHRQENEAAVKVVELTNDNSGQMFDDREIIEAGQLTGGDIWQELGESPFSNFGEVNYSWGENIFNLKSGRVWHDTLTGLVWTAPSDKPMSNQFTMTEKGRSIGSGAVEFCSRLNSLSYAGFDEWTLPSQKQLMQAYVDGSGKYILDRPYYVWSGTEFYGDKTRAWRVNLEAGDVSSSPKDNNNYAICVTSTR